MRFTVADTIEFRGVGLHGGQPVALTLDPAPAGSGIVFERTDLADGRERLIPARYDLVIDTRLCTRLGNAAGASVGTVEHLMAALAGTGITDVLLALDGPEVPILDGSALPFVAALAATGRRALGARGRAIRVTRPVEAAADGRMARLDPADAFEMDFTIDFEAAAIGSQHHRLVLTADAFARELCDCRTFGDLAEVEALRRLGLGRGGSLENAVVVDGGRVLNPGGLRRADEFVRHKMLDAVGDLALAGAPLMGRYTGRRAGHEITNALLHELFAAPESWEWVDAPGALALPPADLLPNTAGEAALAG